MIKISSDKPPCIDKWRVWRQTWMIMRLTALLIIISTLTISAKSYSQKVTLSLQNVPVESVFRQISDQTGYSFLWTKQTIKGLPPVSVSVRKVSLKRAVEVCLKGLPLTYGIRGNVVYIKRKVISSLQISPDVKPPSPPLHEITGMVTDSATGQPLVGVTIKVEGSTIGTTTDAHGKFNLNVPDDAVLEVSYLGYTAKEIPANGRSNINISLSATTTGLNQLVVVGYGTQKKVNLTGSVSTIKFDNELNNRPITNASQALSGKASGIWVSQNSGQPGSDGAQLRIRGWGTLNNSSPLVIIDGVEGSFDQINPKNIESISVLKDAASAAIYGSKAANGVILITTKMGRRNKKMEINLNSYYGIQSLGRRYHFINNSAKYMKLYNQALANGDSKPLYPAYLISAFENSNDRFKYPNTNWNDALFRNASIQEHNLSIMGGSAQSSSFISLSYLNQDGIIPNTNSEKYGVRANFESDVNNWLKITTRMHYSRKASKAPYADVTYGNLGRVYYMFNSSAPFIAPYTRDGHFGSVQAIDSSGTLLYDNRNPLIDAANGATKTYVNSGLINASIQIKFTNNLILNTTLASKGIWTEIDKYNESLFGYTDSGIKTITKNYNREGLEMNRSKVSIMNNNLYSTLHYHKTFAQKHNISVIAGIQMESMVRKNLYARRTEPPKEGLTQVDAGTSGIQGEGNKQGLRMFSYFGRLNYSLLDKYLFEFDARGDASSRFKKGNRWGIFPGFSAGWRLSEEKFIKGLNLFSNLKLRGSWGQLGNQNIAGYWPYLTIINQNFNLSYNLNGSVIPGAAVTSLVDENITWETTSTLDFGLDIGFLNNKLDITVDYFKKITREIIVKLPIPRLMGGVSPPYENLGQMLNNGYEFNVSYDNKESNRNQLGYNIGLNLTYIHNEVTKFQGGNSPDQLYLIREGYSYKTLYGYKAIGIFQSDEEANKYMHSNSFKPKAGNLKFEDLNNDGKLDFRDKQDIGNTIPKYTFGLTSNFKYKGFDLSFLFQGIAGVHMDIHNEITVVTSDNRSLTKMWEDAWAPQNRDTNVPSIKVDNSWDNRQSSFWVKETSFIKLRNIQLGYNIPTDILGKIGIKRFYIYANAQNVFTTVNKEFQGYDPERNTFGSGNREYPLPRIFSFGINLNF